MGVNGNLGALQRDFQSWIVAADEVAAGRLALSDRRGLGVYQNNYRGQLMSCLEESYPQTLAWIGQEAFQAAVADHIDRYPPHSWTLDDYAEGVPASFAERFPHDAEVAELARLELALSNAFIAPDATTLSIDDLSTIAWEEAHLKLVPSVSFLDLSTNATEIWSALDGGSELSPARLLAEPVTLIIWRQEFTCCYQQLDANEQELLPNLIGGMLFNTMCEQLVQRHGTDQGIRFAGELLARWAQAGLLRRPAS